ncbi:hypothetical protein D0809_10300 [Flavobacterium circumlabens]|uniref:Nucleotidyltransferase domain-containing protein n=1 Tax=Flavobacterium circumlabens TaxID=2133765 RepID=A0A4Y7UCG1_9FLAO|nr:hypothetical protein [Flavobacterium circumlabens]TCN58731.1 hypothetical protein EV142_103171 [Flavobacterium circumlabens]TEB44147.1 hypothetical protein D0809_10300 [Flavobacterium circumlabens]
MNTPIYQMFGSENSLDVDVVFFVKEMPETIVEKLTLSKEFSKTITSFFPEKVINANIAVLKNGHLTGVYKGTTDELNNALFYTYRFHEQKQENQITKLLVRDVDLKFLRSCRMILSFVSKTEYRVLVKKALKGNLNEKIQALETIKLSAIASFGKEKNSPDSIKSIAFQLGQTIALQEGKEFYTKNQIAASFPDLRKYLSREENVDLNDLQKWLSTFIENLKTRLSLMKNTSEYKYEDENDFNYAK